MPYLYTRFLALLTLFIFPGMISFSQVTCDTWLYIPANKAAIEITGRSITGNQLTVEALFNRTQPFDPTFHGGDLVSKHCDPTNVNYLLRPYLACITTDQGYFEVVDPNGANSISLNVTYHVAMTYDGSSLKLYRNGVLINQVAASGNLVTNLLPTYVGSDCSISEPWNSGFIGYINEVRVWNAVRTQAQIQNYMYTTLPNPTTQSGLQAYYTFNSLANRANGNYNGVTQLNPSIHQSNPNATFSICSSDLEINCNSYLNVQSAKSGVSLGDLDVTGNQITVEAVFNRTTAYDPNYHGGELVSKHCDPSNVNYLLRPNLAAITTTTGFYTASTTCAADLNTTYHVALVYDGVSLKFYRNKELLAETPATGNLITNNLPTKIGSTACVNNLPSDFIGYINEVRIWNVARTDQQVYTYWDSRLSDPTTQTGLLAYYTFDNLQNKQGNSTWNASLFGTAAISQTNSNCTIDGPLCLSYRVATNPSKPDIGTSATQLPVTGNVILYPNPAKELVKVDYFSIVNNVVNIKVIDITGKTCIYLKKPVSAGKNTITLNVGELNSGVYLVEFINGNNNIQTKKLIINK